MLQVIHDVAPGATLAFHSAIGGEADFADGIIELATEAGCDIIVDDVIYPTDPFFQDSVVGLAVNEVVDMGVAYFSAAGNYGRESWEGTFQPFRNHRNIRRKCARFRVNTPPSPLSTRGSSLRAHSQQNLPCDGMSRSHPSVVDPARAQLWAYRL